MEMTIDRTGLAKADIAADLTSDRFRTLNDIEREAAETVLVVDDEPLVLMSIVDYLVSDGFAVLEAGNADSALLILENNPGITAIFTDLQMPGSMNGLELARQVNLRWPDIRVVVTSGNAGFGPADPAQRDEFIRKPYSYQDVARALRTH